MTLFALQGYPAAMGSDYMARMPPEVIEQMQGGVINLRLTLLYFGKLSIKRGPGGSCRSFY